MKDELIKARISSSMATDVRQQINQMFEALKKKIKDESEIILQDTEQQLRKISAERAKAGAISTQEEKEFESMKAQLEEIATYAQTLKAQLMQLMEGEEA